MNEKDYDRILENMAARILKLERLLNRADLQIDDLDARVVRHNEQIEKHNVQLTVLFDLVETEEL